MTTYMTACFVLLSILLITAVVLLRRESRLHKKQIEALRRETAQAHSDSIHLHLLQETIWQSVNTIYLLAALSEEESSSEEMKEKQRMILAECEKIKQQV